MTGPQFIIDSAMAAQGPELGRPYAAEIFKDTMRAALKIDTQVSDAKKRMIQELVPDVHLIFSGKMPVTHDHPVLYAFREMARNVMESRYKLTSISRRTLVMGATQREVRRYNTNPAVHYYFHASDSKDESRIVPEVLEDLLKMLKKKSSKYNSKLFCVDPTADLPSAVKRYRRIEELYADYRAANKLPDNFHFQPVEATTLVFEDSMYDVSADQLLHYFEVTGAQEAIGYMILPYEFYFPDMPENELYKLSTDGNGNVTFNYRYGQSNGYCHKASTWREFGVRQAIKGRTFDLMTEFTDRFGPVVCFKIMRTNEAKTLTRLIELPRQYQYVRILDIWNCVDLRTGRVNSPLKYYSVYANEYYDTLLWLASLAPASRKLETTVTYVRRRKDGVNLQTKELVAPWHLQDSRVYGFCVTVYMQAALLAEKSELILDNVDPTSVKEKFFAFFRRFGRFTLSKIGIQYLLDLIFSEHLTDKLVLFPQTSVEQWYNVKFNTNYDDVDKYELSASVPIYPEGKDESALPTCPVCLMLYHADIGDQKIKCDHKDTLTTFSMSEAQCQDWFTELADDDTDPEGLAKVKSMAKQNIPRSGFSHKLRVYRIIGRYGTGKSHVIRKLATERDLVLAPFTKLMSDYSGLVDPVTGEKYDLLFKTAHRGMQQFGASRMFVDEYPSLDFRYTMAIAYINQVDEVYIFGDEEQTVIREPDEGWNIQLHLDLDSLSTHTLMVNHRNRPDTVALMRKLYGHELETRRDNIPSFEVMTIADYQSFQTKFGRPVVDMCFSHATRLRYDLGEKATVRASQGGTYDYASIFVTNLDGDTAFVDSLIIVALTRHREKLFVVHDGTPTALKWLEKFDYFEFPETFVTDYAFHYEEEQVADMLDDPIIDKIINDDTIAEAREIKVKEVFSELAADLQPVVDPVLPERPADTGVRSDAYATVKQVLVKHCNALLRERESKPIHHEVEVVAIVPLELTEIPSGVKVITGIRNMRSHLTYVYTMLGAPDQNVVILRLKDFNCLVSYTKHAAITDSVKYFGAADCLLKAIATAMDKPVKRIARGMYKVLGRQTYDKRITGDGFTLADLDLFGKYWAVRFKIDVNDTDAWGDFPTIVGDIEGQITVTIGWTIGHWHSESETLRNTPSSSTTSPSGAGLNNGDSGNDLFDHKKFLTVLSVANSGQDLPSVCVKSTGGVYYLPAYYVNEFTPEFNDHINFFTGPVVEPLVMVKPKDDVYLPETYESIGLNTYEMVDTVFPEVDKYNKYPAVNTIESQLVFDNFRSGQLDQDIVCDVNPRRHLRRVKGFFSYGASSALYYEKENHMQTLQVISERYANKNIKQFLYTTDADRLATIMVDKFAEDCMMTDVKFDDAEFNAIMAECETAMRVKHYQSQTDPDSPDTRVVRFHLKNIAKPKAFGQLNLYKAGQGISAWSKTAQSWFGKAMRVLNARFGSILRSNVIYDNRKTEEQLIAEVNQQLRMIHKLARRGVTDCDQFDSVQNEFTQAIEQKVLKKLGASDLFLTAYYSFRKNYVIQSTYTRVRCKFEKTSGEPGTLLLNTILSMVLTYYLFEGDGKFVIVAKGDDGFRAQLGLRVNEDHLAQVNQFCRLGLKLSFDETIEFCGNVVVDGVFYPSVYRKLAKIISHRFRDYKHFCEYQISLRDWEDKVARADMYKLCSVNALVYGRTTSDAILALNCVRSFAHMNEQQFYDNFPYREPVLGHFSGTPSGAMKFVQY